MLDTPPVKNDPQGAPDLVEVAPADYFAQNEQAIYTGPAWTISNPEDYVA
jgi:hypothetical protein